MHLEDYKNLDEGQINRALIQACEGGDFLLAKELLTSSELSQQADINYNQSHAILYACLHGDLDFVRFALTSPQLVEKSRLPQGFENCLSHALEMGHYDIADYLLTSPELDVKENIKSNGQHALTAASVGCDLPGIQYLLSSDTLTEHADLSYDHYQALNYICSNNYENILEYIVFDYNIQLTEELCAKIASEAHYQKLDRLIKTRQLNEKLEHILPQHGSTIKRAKL